MTDDFAHHVLCLAGRFQHVIGIGLGLGSCKEKNNEFK